MLLIRDADRTCYLKKNKFDKFPEEFLPLKDVQEKIDSCIQLKNLEHMDEEQRAQEISLLTQRFNAIVDDIKGASASFKFTKDNFKEKFIIKAKRDSSYVNLNFNCIPMHQL